MKTLQNFINGKYVSPTSEKVQDLINPATGEVFAKADLSKVVGSSYRVKRSRCSCTTSASSKDLADASSAMKTIPIATASPWRI